MIYTFEYVIDFDVLRTCLQLILCLNGEETRPLLIHIYIFSVIV